MNAVPLHMPDGRIAAYACNNCGQPRGGVTSVVTAQRLEFSKESAEKCCVCQGCGGIVEEARAGWYSRCGACEEAWRMSLRVREADPSWQAERQQAVSDQLAVVNGPSPDAEAILRRLHASYSSDTSDLTDEECAACRVGAEALAKLKGIDA